MSTPSEQAKALGLEYGGFGGWIDPKTREVRARTVDGKLVRVEDDEESQGEDDLGCLILVSFDDELLYTDINTTENKDIDRLIYLLKSVVKTSNDVIVMHSRNSERKVAMWLKEHGITGGAVLVPYGSSDPDKKKELVQKKIHAGYTEIQFFDSDSKALHAVESLKAPYNKRQIKIDTHQIPKLPHDPASRSPEPEEELQPDAV